MGNGNFLDGKFKTENYAAIGGINEKASPYLTGKNQQLDLVNLDFSQPGAMSQRPGSTYFIGATVSGQMTGVYEYQKLNGASFVITSANTNVYRVNAGTFTSIRSGLTNGAKPDFLTFVDRLFVANGAQFFKYDGTNASKFSLPPGEGPGVSGAMGFSLLGSGSGFSGNVYYTYGYLNDRGFLGAVGGTLMVNPAGASQVELLGFTTPSDFGITAIAIYRTAINGTDQALIGFAPAGASLFFDPFLPQQVTPAPTWLYFTLAPSFIEIYANRLVMGGFSSLLSTFFWSETGEPEGVEPENFAEVRTNDGDKLTGMRVYQGDLVLGKFKSIHRFSGDRNDNFNLVEVTDQMGAVNNRCIVTFDDRCFLLDQNGVVEFNGARAVIISDRMESTFYAMNVAAARETAFGIHVRNRNQVWFAIPTDGATLNNTIVVYDYLVDSWTKYRGIFPSSLGIVQGPLSKPQPFFGSYSGQLLYMSPSLMVDVTGGFTLSMLTRFHAEKGQTVEKMFRRLFLNMDPTPESVTLPIWVELFSDFDRRNVTATRMMYGSTFQSRVDFGVEAKTMAARFTTVTQAGLTMPIRIQGYTFAERVLREV